MSTPSDISVNIENPILWRLAMEIAPDSIRAVIWNTAQDATMQLFTLPLDPTKEHHKAVEEAVYGTPMLFNDFGAVDIVVRTQAFMTVPSVLDRALVEQSMHTVCMAGRHDIVRHDHTVCGVEVAWAVNEELSHFLARSFRHPRVHCHMGVLMRFLSDKSSVGNRGKLYAHFSDASPRSVDILVFGSNGALILASTQPYATDEDAVYYILASAVQAGVDLNEDEILLCGNGPARESIMPKLRRFAATVMPLIFPSAAFRAGRDALRAPFPLIILPLCE